MSGSPSGDPRIVNPDDLWRRLNKLRELRADGVRRARFGNEEVEYSTDAEMAAAIADLERQIANAEGAAVVAPVSFHSFRNRRGW